MYIAGLSVPCPITRKPWKKDNSRAASTHHPVACKAAARGSTLQSRTPLPSSHFLNARLMPSGIPSISSAFRGSVLEQTTTELTGTKGLSSAEAARMPYSWAKTKAARNAADLVDLCWGAGARERMLRMLDQGQSARGLFSGLKQK